MPTAIIGLVSLTFSYPLGNRAANNALQQQNLLLKQALIDQRKVQLDGVARDIFQTVRNLETASKQCGSEARLPRYSPARSSKPSKKNFRLGLSTSFNVLQFQNQLTSCP